MKKLFFLISLIFISCGTSIKTIYEVNVPEELIVNQELNDSELEKLRLGVQEHDQENYDSAISYYQKILSEKPNSSMALHEIVFTLNQAGRFKESIEYAKKGQLIDSDLRALFYHMQGVSLDYLGNSKQAIQAFEQGINVNDMFYHLHYSLALTFVKVGEINKSIRSLENALAVNFEHASSHYMLGDIYFTQSRKIPALLAYTYFLMYEPDSPRSQVAFERIEAIFNSAEKDKNSNSINVGINLLGSGNDEFSSAELLLGLHSATRFTKEEVSDIEFIADGYKVVLSTIKETSEKKQSDSFIAKNYLPYLMEVQKADYTETLVYLIFETSLLENVSIWIDENWEKCEKFYEWEPFKEESSQ